MTITATQLTIVCDQCNDEKEDLGWNQVPGDEHWCPACSMEMEQ